MNRLHLSGILAALATLTVMQSAPAGPLTFHIAFDPTVQKTAFTGRVYVVISEDEKREPRLNIDNWFRPPVILARDVVDVLPTETIVIGEGSLSFPPGMPTLEPGEYHIQAIARRSLDHPVPGQGPGDLFSKARMEKLDPAEPKTHALRLDGVVEPRPFRETDNIKLVEMESPSLSRFHKRPVTIRAAVILPKGWSDDPNARFPVLYWLPSFNGGLRMAHMISRGLSSTPGASSVLAVVPDPTCYRGHSVFADSENNGPWGRALIDELIPEVEKRFRGAGSGEHRYVAGVSSGGWSALWLQITYPDAFSGCWAHAPDPVDFRDFQRINLYEPGSNMYTESDGKRRPLARRGDEVMLWYEDFVRHEIVLGPGGQIHSFEAVFSRRQPDGQPELMFDRATGNVITSVAKSWERFDLRLILERNWKALAPKLAGKLHVYGGEVDTFYLEGAVALLEESLEKLGSDADVRVIPEMGHGLYREAIGPMYSSIVEKFRREFAQSKKDGGTPRD